jgi:uncharacterized protein
MPAARLKVYIQPHASKTEFAGTHDGVVKIRIAAPAVENAANRALVEFIAQHFGTAKGRVRVLSGGASRRKILEIDGIGADTIAATLGPKVSMNSPLSVVPRNARTFSVPAKTRP